MTGYISYSMNLKSCFLLMNVIGGSMFYAWEMLTCALKAQVNESNEETFC